MPECCHNGNSHVKKKVAEVATLADDSYIAKPLELSL
jgi:hypothetical protein